MMSIAQTSAIQLEFVGSNLMENAKPKMGFLQNIRYFAAWCADVLQEHLERQRGSGTAASRTPDRRAVVGRPMGLHPGTHRPGMAVIAALRHTSVIAAVSTCYGSRHRAGCPIKNRDQLQDQRILNAQSSSSRQRQS
jgi:hypothetical protein